MAFAGLHYNEIRARWSAPEILRRSRCGLQPRSPENGSTRSETRSSSSVSPTFDRRNKRLGGAVNSPGLSTSLVDSKLGRIGCYRYRSTAGSSGETDAEPFVSPHQPRRPLVDSWLGPGKSAAFRGKIPSVRRVLRGPRHLDRGPWGPLRRTRSAARRAFIGPDPVLRPASRVKNFQGRLTAPEGAVLRRTAKTQLRSPEGFGYEPAACAVVW
jgi:hypothetical protein